MTTWFRVFGIHEAQPEPAALLVYLHDMGFEVKAKFRGDDLGWFRCELVVPDEPAPLVLERYLATEEGIRNELNTWAAWLETAPENPHSGRLMRHMISTRQVFTLEAPPEADDEEDIEEMCLAI